MINRPVRRLLLTPAILGVAMAGLTALAPPASAVPWTGHYQPTTTLTYSNAGCNVSSPGVAAPLTPLPANTVVPINNTASATGSSASPEHTGTMSASVTGSAYVAENAGGVTSIDIKAHLKAEANRTRGILNTCEASAEAAVTLNGTFSTSTPGVLVLDVSQVGEGFTQNILLLERLTPTGQGHLSLLFNLTGTRHYVVPVQAGEWGFMTAFNLTAASKGDPMAPPPSGDVEVELHADFKPFGSAAGNVIGAGAKYVTLPDAQNCTTHSITADFTNKAGKPLKGKNKAKGENKAKKRKPVIKKATFYVNGVKVRTVKKPHKNTLTTVGNLPADETSVVKVKLTLPGKAPVTLHRTYLPCE